MLVVYEDGLPSGESRWLLAEDSTKRLFYFDGRLLEKAAFPSIGTEGLVRGESDYFIAGDSQKAIFKATEGKVFPVSEFYDSISPEGLVLSQSRYSIAKKDKCWLLLDYGKPVFSSKEKILPEGLVLGVSDFFLCTGEKDILYKGFKKVYEAEEIKAFYLLNGVSQYFLARNNGWRLVSEKTKSRPFRGILGDYFLRGMGTFILTAEDFQISLRIAPEMTEYFGPLKKEIYQALLDRDFQEAQRLERLAEMASNAARPFK